MLLDNPRFTRLYNVSRITQSGTWVKGRYVESSSPVTVLQIRASVQPLGPRETMMLPESYRTKFAQRVYTKTLLKTVSVSENKNCDVITINGEAYDIVSCEPWTDNDIYQFYKAIAVRQEEVAT